MKKIELIDWGEINPKTTSSKEWELAGKINQLIFAHNARVEKEQSNSEAIDEAWQGECDQKLSLNVWVQDQCEHGAWSKDIPHGNPCFLSYKTRFCQDCGKKLR